MSADSRLTLTVRPTSDEAEVKAAFALRVKVFCDEQGVDRDAELDELDAEALQIVALEDGEVVGTCRLRFGDGECKLERMAVSKPRRSAGIGAALLETAEAEARGRGADHVLLHAQLQARDFYEGAGYRPLSEEVLIEDGIEHVRMRSEL